MGLWKQHFHWSVLLGWGVLGWILGALWTFAGILLFFDQYAGANVCFVLSSMFVFAKIAHLSISANEPIFHRILFTFILFGLVGVGIVETVRGVNKWADSKRNKTENSAKQTPLEPGRVSGNAAAGTGTIEVKPAQPQAKRVPEIKPAVPAGKSTSPKLKTTTNAEIVSRIYMRGADPPPGESSSYEPYIQELFYEWALSLMPNSDVSNIVVVVQGAEPNSQDRFSVNSISAVISDWKPHWMSGFEEPSRPPDDYVKSVSFSEMRKDETVTIRVRRPIYLARGENKLTPDKFPDHLFEIATDPNYEIEKHVYDAESRFPLLVVQIGAFTRYSGRKDRAPLRIRPNPDEPMPPLGPNETEGSIELRCKNDTCTEFTAQQLESRRSKVQP
jgi:hypothetical protein